MKDGKHPTPGFWLTVALVAVLVGAAIGVIAWHLRWQSVDIAEVSKTTELELTPKPGDGWPMRITRKGSD